MIAFLPFTHYLDTREEKEKKEAKERYWKVSDTERLQAWIILAVDVSWHLQLHEQGKTEQAKADLARLQKIRAEREAAQAKRKAESEGSLLVFEVCQYSLILF